MAEYPTRVIPVKLPNGATMHFEVSEIEPTVVRPSGTTERDVAGGRRFRDEDYQEADVVNPPSLLEIPEQDFQSVMKSIEGIAQAVSETAERSSAFEVNVEFGLELGLESGKLTTLFVKGSGKANLKVALKWTRSDKRTSQPAENASAVKASVEKAVQE